jgi:hypothetical protein
MLIDSTDDFATFDGEGLFSPGRLSQNRCPWSD